MLWCGGYLLLFHLISDWSQNNKHSWNLLWCSLNSLYLHVQILPRLSTCLQGNMTLKCRKVYLFIAKQKEIPSQLILGSHVVRRNMHVIKTHWMSQKSCMMKSTSALLQTLWVPIQEMSVFVSYWKITYLQLTYSRWDV